MAAKKKNKKLIQVRKGNEVIEISPLVLADHKALGWIPVKSKAMNEGAPEEEAPEGEAPEGEAPNSAPESED